MEKNQTFEEALLTTLHNQTNKAILRNLKSEKIKATNQPFPFREKVNRGSPATSSCNVNLNAGKVNVFVIS